MRILLITFWACLLTLHSYANKVSSVPFAHRQSDGKTVLLVAHGDENYCWITTTDDVLVIKKGTDYRVAFITPQGEAVASAICAHEKNERTEEEKALIKAQDLKAFEANLLNKRSQISYTRIPSDTPGYFLQPHGKPKVLTLLVQFKDKKFAEADPRKTFEQYLNSDSRKLTAFGNGEERNITSVKQYFTDMSYGAFQPQFEIIDPITLPENLAYYGAGMPAVEKHRMLIQDAIAMIDKEQKLKAFDQNADGFIDCICVIYAGYGQSSAPQETDALWPKCFFMGTLIRNGIKIGRCMISNELMSPQAKTPDSKPMINGIGIFCHEFSHCLGLPDIYPTNGLNLPNQSMDYWDLMDSGEYTYNGWFPTPYTAWEREYLGWIKIEKLKKGGTVRIGDINHAGNKAYKLVNEADSSEYYVLQAVDGTHNWYYPFKNKGLLVYHVKYDAKSFNLRYNTVNNEAGKPRMAVVPADGILAIKSGNFETFWDGVKNDLFPGPQQITDLEDDLILPNHAFYTPGASPKPIYNIRVKDDDVLIDFMHDTRKTDGINPIVIERDAMQGHRIYNISGVYLGSDSHNLPAGIYIVDGKKVLLP